MRRLILALPLLGLLTDVRPALSQWDSLPAFPETHFGAAAATVSNQLFVLGGRSSGTLNQARFWTAATQTWDAVAPMLQTRVFHGAAASSGRLFAIGGFDQFNLPLTSVERLDPAGGSWTSVNPMPYPRTSMAVGELGGAIVVAAGEGQGGNIAQTLRFDPVTNGWEPLANIPTPRSGAASAVLNGRLWVLGGSSGGPLTSVEIYDPATDSWSAGPDLPEPLWLARAAILDGRLWIMGGMDQSFQRSSRVYSLGSLNTWQSEASLPEPSAAAAVASTGSCLVVAGGVDASGRPSSASFAFCMEEEPPPPPPPPAEDTLVAKVTIHPPVLNRSSRGNWITVHIQSCGWSLDSLVMASLRLQGVAPDIHPRDIGADENGDRTLKVKFPRAPFTKLPNGDHDLVLLGKMLDGTTVRGIARLRVKGTSDDVLVQNPHGGVHNPMIPTGNGNGRTSVGFGLSQPAQVTLEILDVQGRIVERIENAWLPAGDYTRAWPAAGRSVSPGLYFARLRVNQTEQSIVKLSVTGH